MNTSYVVEFVVLIYVRTRKTSIDCGTIMMILMFMY